MHFCSLANLYISRTVYQIRLPSNVMCGIWRIQIIQPIFYNGTVTWWLASPTTHNNTWLVWWASSLKCMQCAAFTCCGPFAYSIKCPRVFNQRIRSTNNRIWYSGRVAYMFAALDTSRTTSRTTSRPQIYMTNTKLFRLIWSSVSFLLR